MPVGRSLPVLAPPGLIESNNILVAFPGAPAMETCSKSRAGFKSGVIGNVVWILFVLVFHMWTVPKKLPDMPDGLMRGIHMPSSTANAPTMLDRFPQLPE